MQGTAVTDRLSISTGGAWGFTSPSAVYQAPGVEWVGWMPKAPVQDSAGPIRPEGGRLTLFGAIGHGEDRPLKTRSPLHPKPLGA